ncbi:MAG: TolC family protein [Gammaproteobacteria bacterium]
MSTLVSMRLSALATAMALTGCAGFSPDAGYGPVRALAQARTTQPLPAAAPGKSDASAEVAALLDKPVGLDAALRIALLGNRNLQADYAELGIAEADLVQASRLPNPAFSFSRLKSGAGLEIERKLTLPLLGLLTMPVTQRLEQRRYQAAQVRAAGEMLRVLDATRRAWVSAVAAQQSALYMEQVATATEASSELARRMRAAGNWSALQQAREEAFHAEARAQLARARAAHLAEREKLTRLMGLGGPQASYKLPDRLPDLPAAPRQQLDAQAQALDNRLDLLAAQQELAGLASSPGLTRATRFINVLDASALRKREPGGERASGWEVELQVPLFDWGGARVARAEAQYMQAVHRTAALALDAGSELRQAYGSYRSAYDAARHYRDEVVPLRKQIADEQLLRYNGMLASVFDLLADARAQVESVNAAIEAQRDFWIADADLEAAMAGIAH